MSELTHLDEHGTARMVDVGDKPATDRRAIARAVVRMTPATAAKVQAGDARSVRAGAGAAAGGCRERPLADGVSADAPRPGRLAAVERVPVPRAGFYTAATAPAACRALSPEALRALERFVDALHGIS